MKEIANNTLRFLEVNGVKSFQILVHLVFFAGVKSSTKKGKENLTRSDF
jgi:hypothetical protein